MCKILFYSILRQFYPREVNNFSSESGQNGRPRAIKQTKMALRHFILKTLSDLLSNLTQMAHIRGQNILHFPYTSNCLKTEVTQVSHSCHCCSWSAEAVYGGGGSEMLAGVLLKNVFKGQSGVQGRPSAGVRWFRRLERRSWRIVCSRTQSFLAPHKLLPLLITTSAVKMSPGIRSRFCPQVPDRHSIVPQDRTYECRRQCGKCHSPRSL